MADWADLRTAKAPINSEYVVQPNMEVTKSQKYLSFHPFSHLIPTAENTDGWTQ